MVDQVCTRFGVLDHRLAGAVRHALEAVVVDSALSAMNAVHLRMTSDDEIRRFAPAPEPPSHRWYEFMTECFGPAEFQSTTVRSSALRSNFIAPLGYIDFAQSYAANAAEERIIHDLFVAVGAFLVAESTAMDERIEPWNFTSWDNCASERLYSIAEQVGTAGFDLLARAEAGTWRDLLLTTTCEPGISMTNIQKIHKPSAPVADLSAGNTPMVRETSDTENRDYVVLMVDSVEASHRQALTERALCELREAANTHSGSSPKEKVLIVSAADGRHSEPLPLTSRRPDKRPGEHSSGKILVEHTLDEAAKLVEVLSQPVDGVSTIAASITRPLGRQGDLITGICSASRTYAPTLLIVLSSDYNSISTLDLSSKSSQSCSPRELVDVLRNHEMLPDLRGVPVVFLWSGTSLKEHLGAYWLAICSAAGARSCEFHFSSPKSGLSDWVAGVVEPSPLRGALARVFHTLAANYQIFWRVLMPVASTATVVVVGIRAVGTVAESTLTVVIAIVVTVLVLLGVGVLIGSHLQNRNIEQANLRLAQRIRQLNEQETLLNRDAHYATSCDSCSQPTHQHSGRNQLAKGHIS